MVFDADKFVFEPPPIRWARRILIKPCAPYPLPYPISTSREILAKVISAIRKASEADIILLEGSPQGESMKVIYRALSYQFPRLIYQDVKDCALVEVENPLSHSFALPSFWLPNILLSCDYLISITPLKVFAQQGSFSIRNLLSLLPLKRYQGEAKYGWGNLYQLGIEKVIADLYFTIPFDLGIIEAEKRFLTPTEFSTEGEVEDFHKVFVGEPYEADREAADFLKLPVEHLRLIRSIKEQSKSK